MDDNHSPDTTLSHQFDAIHSQFLVVESGEGNPTDAGYETSKCLSNIKALLSKVQDLALFSTNESVEELPTGHLKFLLLHAMIGTLELKRTKGDRVSILNLAEASFKQYLNLLSSYQIISSRLPWDSAADDQTSSDHAVARSGGAPRTLADQGRTRAEKIRKLEQQKELQQRLSELREHLKMRPDDEDVERELRMTELRSWSLRAFDELASIESRGEIKMFVDGSYPLTPPVSINVEKPLAAMRVVEGGKERIPNMPPQPSQPPLRPIILTRNEVQKQVFGLGYPSLPTLTVEEWRQQMVDEGRFPKDGSSMNSHMHMQQSKADPDAEDAARDAAEDRSDEDALQRARDWDDYKDDHRRGYGNTKNKG